ncbi:MAG: DUF4340 domain-containing protein [Candidatus Hydrogenedentes bacterium]|nr:DUF4340 domain-containing protein [Candidatus Hydrogenedentota bacterium]
MKARTTIALLIALIVLSGGYWLMIQHEQSAQQAREEAKKVFSFAPEEIRHVTLERLDDAAIEGSRDEAGKWAITRPASIPANQELWKRLAGAVAELSNERTIENEPADLTKYELDRPRLTMTLDTATNSGVRLTVGMADPTQSFRYASVNEGAVFLVSNREFFELDRALLDLRDRRLIHVGDEGVTRLEYVRFRQKRSAPATEGASTAEGPEESVPVILEKSPEGTWQLRSPVQARADEELVQKLISELQYAQGRDYVATPEQLADYGLEPPGARIAVSAGIGKTPQTLYFGGTATGDPEGGLYVRRAETGEVCVMDGSIISAFPESPDAFREQRLFTARAADIRAMEYRSGHEEFRLELDPAKGWTLVQPAVDDTDQVAVSNFISTIKMLKGKNFPEETPGMSTGLDQPSIEWTLTLGSENPTEATLRVGAPLSRGDFYYARQDTGALTTITNLDYGILKKTPYDFRSRTLLDFQKQNATRVRLQFEGVQFEFEKRPEKWVIVEPESKILENQGDIGILLDALTKAKLRTVEAPTVPSDLSPYGLDTPILVVSVVAKVGPSQDAKVFGPVQVGKPAEDDSKVRFAVVGGRPELLRVGQSVVDGVREALKGVRDRPSQ